MILVAGARLFSWVLAYGMVPVTVANFMLATVSDPLLFLLLLNLLLLLVGMFMEANAAFVMLVPVLFPIAQALGVDPIQFNVIFAVNLCIGLITPPVGLCLFAVADVAGISPLRLLRSLIPFFVPLLISLLVVTLVPDLSLYLPRMFGFVR
jgi:TRAP-type transport system large permease protein